MKRNQAEILAEVDKLVDDQLARLASRSDRSEAVHYVHTKRRIDQLLMELASDDPRDE